MSGKQIMIIKKKMKLAKKHKIYLYNFFYLQFYVVITYRYFFQIFRVRDNFDQYPEDEDPTRIPTRPDPDKS